MSMALRLYGSQASNGTVAACFHNMGIMHKAVGDLPRAQDALSRACIMREAVHEGTGGHVDIVSTRVALGQVRRCQRVERVHTWV